VSGTNGVVSNTLGALAARQQGELTELTEWVEGLRAAAHKARHQGNATLAEALDATRFEVYQGFSTRSYINNKGQPVSSLELVKDSRY
jgi:hypothetical protein